MDESYYQQMRAKIEAAYRADLAAMERMRATDERLSRELAPESPRTIHVQPEMKIPVATEAVQATEFPGIGVLTSPADAVSPPALKRTVGKGDVSAAILMAAKTLPETFVANDVIDKIRKFGFLNPLNESSVRQSVGRLAETGKLRVVTQGAGRMPSKYSLPSAPISILDNIDDI